MGSIFSSYCTISICKFSYLHFCETSVEVSGVNHVLRGFNKFVSSTEKRVM